MVVVTSAPRRCSFCHPSQNNKQFELTGHQAGWSTEINMFFCLKRPDPPYNRRVYFTAPMVMPLTSVRWKAIKKIRQGKIPNTAAAL